VSWIDLDGAVNARDVGGLPTVDGRTTRSGVLLRSDNLQDLSEADVRRLVEDLGVRTVLDLRSSGELHLTGPGPLREAGPVHHQLSLIPEWDGEPDRDEVDRALDPATRDRALPSLAPGARQQGPTDLGDHYGDYLAKAGPNLGRALRVLADPDSGTTLVHCAAGKDRTGVVVALALSLVGVQRDAVVADYLRSAERADRILTRLKATTAYGPSLARTTVADITPVATSMEHFLDAVDREHGGPHGLALSLGVDEEAVARLGARLVGTSALAR
jgi:protein-tyrosine phosphatase